MLTGITVLSPKEIKDIIEPFYNRELSGKEILQSLRRKESIENYFRMQERSTNGNSYSSCVIS